MQQSIVTLLEASFVLISMAGGLAARIANPCWLLNRMPPHACQNGCVAVLGASGFDCSACSSVLCSDVRMICAPSGCLRILLLESASSEAVARLVCVPICSFVFLVHTGHVRVLIVQ